MHIWVGFVLFVFHGFTVHVLLSTIQQTFKHQRMFALLGFFIRAIGLNVWSIFWETYMLIVCWSVYDNRIRVLHLMWPFYSVRTQLNLKNILTDFAFREILFLHCFLSKLFNPFITHYFSVSKDMQSFKAQSLVILKRNSEYCVKLYIYGLLKFTSCSPMSNSCVTNSIFEIE